MIETLDYKELIDLGRGKALDYAQNETFIDAFLRQVEKTPESTAVVDEFGSISYEELNRRSDYLAGELIKSSVKQGDFIAIKLPRVKEFIVAVIGIWKAGAAYLPVDPTYPEERIRYMLEDSGAKLRIDESWIERLRKSAPVNGVPVNEASPDGVAIIMYTSGSTGKPKGVISLHRAVSVICSWMPEMMEYDSQSQVAEVPSFSFVGSCPLIFPPLVSGSTVHIISETVRRDFSLLNDYFVKEDIRQVCLVSGLAKAFLRSFHPDNLIIMTGGEAVCGIEPGSVRLIAVYGMSETMQAVSSLVVSDSTTVPMIGRPAPGVTLVLEDETGAIVPRGEIGEVCVSSPQVAVGYWHNDELTSRSFVDRPWSQYKVFRSGDLARWNENGELEFHGRKDSMVKIRGNRVELGEVEAAMLKIEGVNTGVVAMKDVGGESLLCGYYTGDGRIDEGVMRSSLSAFLPSYMVPSIFMRMDAFPKLPNGKLDRKSLPVPEIDPSKGTVRPESLFEKSVFPVVAREMGNVGFGVTTNLITLGLTSLRAIRLSSVVKQELGISISQSQMLAHPSIREWEALCNESAEVIPVEPIREYYPLTDNQMGLYVEWERNRDSDQYNLPFILKLKGGDGEKLLSSVKESINLHPIFKMQIGEHDGMPIQIRRDDAELSVGFEHLDFEPDEDYFRGLVRPFTLIGGDLARFAVFTSPEAAWLFCDVHHIIFDGSSANIFLQSLSSLYRGLSPESESVTAYDYALYREQWKKGDEFREYGSYFDSLLKETDSFTYPSSTNGTADGRLGEVTIDIPRQRIKEFCHGCGVTENSFFATVLTQVFHRVTRERSIQMAMVSSGRSMTQLSSSIGMFVQTLPLVSRINGGSVKDALTSIHTQIVGSLSRDRYPYTSLSELYGLKPNVMYAYQGDLADELDFGTVGAVNHRIPVTCAISPLSVEVLPEPGRYRVKFEYDCGMYGVKEISSLAEAVRTLARAMAESSYDTLIGALALVSEEEKNSLVSLGTGSDVKYNQNETFIDLFLRNVASTPDAVAIVDSLSRMTYGELDGVSNALAARLISDGVRPGDFVAVKMPRVKEFMVAVLGIWKAGAAYVPIDPEYPEGRVNYMLEDSGAKIVLTPENLVHTQGGCVCTNLARPENPAYMIYTSGSTGKPKGVVVTHANLRAFMEWLPAELELKPGEAVAQHASFSFDASVCDLYSSIAAGATLHILSSELRKDLDGLSRYLKDNRIVGSTLSTQLGMELLNACDIKMRYMVLGGEKLKQVRRTSTRLYNGYGPTEFTVWSSHHIVNQEIDGENIPIGRPVPNTASLILDTFGNLMPLGMAGELCLAGAQLSNGYWHRPELTEKVFVPCRALGGAKIYRTGDLARWNENGELEYLGRIDNQVKLRGFRIEMGEIEAALSKISGISSSAAEVKLVNGIQHLCAYYVSRTDIDETVIREELSKSLTEYMIPDAFIRLDSMPLTPGGKIDRKALPLPELRADEIVPPETKMEIGLFAVVSDELGTDQFGVTTNLLSMGLTSIRAIRLSMAIKNRLGLNVSTGDILSSPRIRDWKESVSETVETREIQEYYPLTDNQLGIYIDWEQHRDDLQYNVPSAMRFNGVDAEKMVAALKEVISNHPSLKTRIVQVEGDVQQQRRDDAEIPVIYEHLETEPSAPFFQSRVRPFNLLEDNLARFEVYSAGTATYLFYDIHHIIFDGGAADILMSDLQRSLSGVVLKAEKVSAFDYALYYDNWKRSDSFSDCENYFDNLVSGTESFLYPTGIADHLSEGKSASVSVSVPMDNIRACCRGLGITENAYFATVITQALHRISREMTIQIATISNGRSMEQLSDTVGMFVQTLPLVSRKNRGCISEILHEMQSQLVETLKRDKYPYTRLAERYGIKPNVLYAYQGGVMDDGGVSGSLNPEVLPLTLDTAKTPVSVNVFTDKDYYSVVLEYDAGMYSRRDMELLSNALSTFAVTLAEESPEDDISCAGLTAPSDVERLLGLGTGDKLEYDRTETFIDQFRRNVCVNPDSVSVVDFRSSMTYKELDDVSNALAARLVSDGVRSGDFVAVKMPRVKEFMVAVLGIWKAGAAYVPIDPEYPEARISYMLEDSGAKIVLTPENLVQTQVGCVCTNLARPEGPAYMIYTSGSTGKPKGVVVTHANLRAFMAWLPAELELKPGEAVAHHASFSFDASVCDLYSSIAAGATLHILSSELRKDLDGLSRYLKDNRIVGSTLSTQLGMELLNACDIKMRYMVLGGEKLKQVRRTSTRLYNGYGPTEFTVWSSHHIVNQEIDGENIPIGRPVPNTASLILDTFGNLMPLGMAGELCLAGAQLSNGYWHRPELTEKVFVPCRALGGAKIYRTGDLARWNENGELEYLGRIDNQVKLRGFRIEMGEIEAALSKIEGIGSAAVEVKSVNGTQHLCAYYVADAEMDESAMREELSKSLTAYMIPDVFVRLEAMPLTPNGKIDRKVLPLPELKDEEYVAPETDLEVQICSIFGEILGISKYGATRDFFRSGGTSIVCIKAVARMQAVRLDVVYGDIFKYKTPRALSDFISGKRRKENSGINVFQFGDYDYTAIDSLLMRTPESIPSDFTLQSLGTVLLTGATGFLGIHVLCSLMEMTDSKVVVLIRPRAGITCEERLRAIWLYYFGFTQDLYKDRIFYLEGDITDTTLGDTLSAFHYDTVINCSAYVRHFVADDTMDRINVQGVRNLIECCAGCGARLVHISTYSIGGLIPEESNQVLDERHLYIGQRSSNDYVRTKFLAERYVLDAVASGRIRGKIMRLGNLMGRRDDGEFQINTRSNAFVNLLRSFDALGCISSSQSETIVEMSGIDYVALAVTLLSQVPDDMVVFHPYTTFSAKLSSIIDAMSKAGHSIEIVPDDRFAARVEELRADEGKAEYLQGILHYQTHVSEGFKMSNTVNEWTSEVLKKVGFNWTPIDDGYLSRFIKTLDEMMMFGDRS